MHRNSFEELAHNVTGTPQTGSSGSLPPMASFRNAALSALEAVKQRESLFEADFFSPRFQERLAQDMANEELTLGREHYGLKPTALSEGAQSKYVGSYSDEAPLHTPMNDISPSPIAQDDDDTESNGYLLLNVDYEDISSSEDEQDYEPVKGPSTATTVNKPAAARTHASSADVAAPVLEPHSPESTRKAFRAPTPSPVLASEPDILQRYPRFVHSDQTEIQSESRFITTTEHERENFTTSFSGYANFQATQYGDNNAAQSAPLVGQNSTRSAEPVRTTPRPSYQVHYQEVTSTTPDGFTQKKQYRDRQEFTPKQRFILEEEFVKDPYCKHGRKKTLGPRLGLQPDLIVAFFSTCRRKLRRRVRRDQLSVVPYSTPAHPAQRMYRGPIDQPPPPLYTPESTPVDGPSVSTAPLHELLFADGSFASRPRPRLPKVPMQPLYVDIPPFEDEYALPPTPPEAEEGPMQFPVQRPAPDMRPAPVRSLFADTLLQQAGLHVRVDSHHAHSHASTASHGGGGTSTPAANCSQPTSVSIDHNNNLLQRRPVVDICAPLRRRQAAVVPPNVSRYTKGNHASLTIVADNHNMDIRTHSKPPYVTYSMASKLDTHAQQTPAAVYSMAQPTAAESSNAGYTLLYSTYQGFDIL